MDELKFTNLWSGYMLARPQMCLHWNVHKEDSTRVVQKKSFVFPNESAKGYLIG